MTDEPHIHDLARQIARLEGQLEAQEERMKTMTAENEGALDRLRSDMAKRDADMAAGLAKRDADLAADIAKRDVEAAKRDVEAAKRDKDNQRWVVGFGIAQMVLTITVLAAGFAFLGILIGLPG